MMKYNVGDKVKIRKDLIVNEYYGEQVFIKEMKQYADKEVTISRVVKDEENGCYGVNSYNIKEDGEKWYWTDEMFEDEDKYEDEFVSDWATSYDEYCISYHIGYSAPRSFMGHIIHFEPNDMCAFNTSKGQKLVLIHYDDIDFIIPKESD